MGRAHFILRQFIGFQIGKRLLVGKIYVVEIYLWHSAGLRPERIFGQATAILFGRGICWPIIAFAQYQGLFRRLK